MARELEGVAALQQAEGLLDAFRNPGVVQMPLRLVSYRPDAGQAATTRQYPQEAVVSDKKRVLGECPVCERTDVTVTKRGKIRRHKGDVWMSGHRQICEGAGSVPKASEGAC